MPFADFRISMIVRIAKKVGFRKIVQTPNFKSEIIKQLRLKIPVQLK
jgi:hypothetical protein